MKLLFTLLANLMCLVAAQAQNLNTALRLNDAEHFRGAFLVQEIQEIYIPNTDKGAAKQKTIRHYDAQQKLILESIYQADQLLSKDTVTYFSPGGLKKARIAETWDARGEYQRKIQNFEYNGQGFLVRIRDFDSGGYLTNESRLKNNGKGFPYLLDKFDAHDNMLGANEEAEFLWDENRVVIKKMNMMGKESSRDTVVLDFRQAAAFPGKGEAYNVQGELTKDARYTYEYRYDEHGNWVEKKRFEPQMLNGKEKKNLLDKWERKYVYRAKK